MPGPSFFRWAMTGSIPRPRSQPAEYPQSPANFTGCSGQAVASSNRGIACRGKAGGELEGTGQNALPARYAKPDTTPLTARDEPAENHLEPFRITP